MANKLTTKGTHMLGWLLATLRRSRNLSQKELAAASNRSVQTIRAIEANPGAVRLCVLEQVASVLGVGVDVHLVLSIEDQERFSEMAQKLRIAADARREAQRAKARKKLIKDDRAQRLLEARRILGKVIDQADWCEAGTAEYPIQDWWKEHKKEDAKRHKEVEADAKRQAVRHEAYKRLTPAQRKALGLRAGRNPVSRMPLHEGIDAPADPSDEDEGDEEV